MVKRSLERWVETMGMVDSILKSRWRLSGSSGWEGRTVTYLAFAKGATSIWRRSTRKIGGRATLAYGGESICLRRPTLCRRIMLKPMKRKRSQIMSTTRQNLALLALGLHRLSRKLGSEGFNISYYLADINCGNWVNRIAYAQQLSDRLRTSLEYYPDHPCGTTACAVGHGPLFGLEVPDAASTPIMVWTDYIEGKFPDLSASAVQWMFDSLWGSMDLELET